MVSGLLIKSLLRVVGRRLLRGQVLAAGGRELAGETLAGGTLAAELLTSLVATLSPEGRSSVLGAGSLVLRGTTERGLRSVLGALVAVAESCLRNTIYL